MVALGTCSHSSTKCSLECEGDIRDSGLVTYRWKTDDGQWNVFGSAQQPEQFIINNDEEGKKFEKIFCEMKNPFNVKQSDPYTNPYYSKGMYCRIVGPPSMASRHNV